MGGCCRWGWLVRQGDTPDEIKIKTTFFPFALIVVLLPAVTIGYVLQDSNQMLYVIGNSCNAFAMLLFMGGVVSNAISASKLIDAVMVLCTVGICATDGAGAARSSPFRAWAYLVLVLDLALVFKRDHMSRFIIPFVVVYLAVVQVESVSRFGLYEAGYWGSKGVESSQCNC
eukprot:Hpha_TRINITY_DN15384_c3_g1::TRINITY_DN15384_c3_g1_i1::g.88057::m.88057